MSHIPTVNIGRTDRTAPPFGCLGTVPQKIGLVREAREATFRELCGSGGVEADGVAETVGVVGDASCGSLGSRVAW